MIDDDYTEAVHNIVWRFREKRGLFSTCVVAEIADPRVMPRRWVPATNDIQRVEFVPVERSEIIALRARVALYEKRAEQARRRRAYAKVDPPNYEDPRQQKLTLVEPIPILNVPAYPPM